MTDNEKDRLENIAKSFTSRRGFNSRIIYYAFLSLKPYFKGKSVLEFGCADGQVTEMLVNFFDRVIAIDGSEKFIEEIKNRIKATNLEAVHSLFENFKPKEKFDTIIMSHVLEHVIDPISVLKNAKEWLSTDGVILIVVPNANSIHRQAGLKMGLLKECNALNELDIEQGHRRVYNWDKLEKDIKQSELKIIDMGGLLLKPLTNKQIEETWTEQMMDAFYELGKRYPEIAADIYAVCTV